MSETVYNPFTGTEEILFKDVDGKLKVLRGETVVPWQPPVRPPPPAVPPEGFRRAASPVAIAPSPLDPVVDETVAALQLAFADPALSRRLRSVVLSRFKDVRDSIEIREVLRRAPAAGGLGLDGTGLDRAVAVIDRAHQKFFEAMRQQHDQTYAALSANVGPAAPPKSPPTVPLALTPLPAKIPPRVAPVPKVSPAAPAIAATAPAAPPVLPKVLPPRLGGVVPPPVPAVVPLARGAGAPVAAQGEPQRAATPPVKYRPQLVGPLEELKEMTIVDFRRLDADPRQATARIAEKIALLEQQSFAHKAAAITAWRQGEVFTRYTELAGIAMADKRPIAQVIASRPAHDQTPTVAEFEAIADFNRTLRF